MRRRLGLQPSATMALTAFRLIAGGLVPTTAVWLCGIKFIIQKSREVTMKYLSQIGKLLLLFGSFVFLSLYISVPSTSVNPVLAQSCVSPPNDLVGWWPGDNDASDISENNNHAQLVGGAQASVLGIVDGAFSFD